MKNMEMRQGSDLDDDEPMLSGETETISKKTHRIIIIGLLILLVLPLLLSTVLLAMKDNDDSNSSSEEGMCSVLSSIVVYCIVL